VWYQFISKDEGDVAFMYLDTKGLVTVGIGNLIDPMSLAVPLPFQLKAGNRLNQPAGAQAGRAQIEAEWKHLKNHPNRGRLASGGHRLCERETNLELNVGARRQLFDRTTATFEATLKRYFFDYDRWPADAQLAVMAMGWGLGPAFPPRFPRFTAACRARDFAKAAAESNIKTWHVHRYDPTPTLHSNAAVVEASPGKYRSGIVHHPTKLAAAAAAP
jgi:hypothetical protein